MSEGTQVYFIQEQRGGSPDDNLIKIGFSRNVFQRRFTLQFSRKCPVVILATFPGTRLEERKLHERFAAYRVTGEWFRPCKEIFDMVKSDTLPALPGVVATPATSATFYLDENWLKLRHVCLEKGTNPSRIVRQLIASYLREEAAAPVPVKKGKGGK